MSFYAITEVIMLIIIFPVDIESQYIKIKLLFKIYELFIQDVIVIMVLFGLKLGILDRRQFYKI